MDIKIDHELQCGQVDQHGTNTITQKDKNLVIIAEITIAKGVNRLCPSEIIYQLPRIVTSRNLDLGS